MRLASVVVCLVAAVAGCSLVVGTDGLTGEMPANDAGAQETSLDGAQASDGPLGDAGARGCGVYTDATFCQDFDDPTTALSASTWTVADTADPGGTITLVEAGAVSLPNAARLSLLDTTSGCQYLRLSRTFTGSLSGLSTRLSIRPDSEGIFLALVAAPSETPGATYRVLVGFDKPRGSAGQLFVLVQKHESGGFSDFSSDSLPFDASPFGRSFDVAVEVTAAPNAKVVVREGVRTLTLAAPPALAITGARIDYGPYCRGETTTVTLDDVVIWATP